MADDLRARALHVLQSVFGYPAFRGEQADIIDLIAGGGDALVLKPTGGGKSLCYQIPSLLRDGCGVVISPLIALMQDQVDALAELGVRAAFLNSTQDFDETLRIERALRRGELDLLYIAPERLMTPRCLELLDSARIALFAIDEAHCVSQWGHDFRPEYIRLSVLHERYPQVPRIALTATADFQTRDEIVHRLQLDGARQFISSFDRPNIRYQIVEKETVKRQLLDFIRGEHAGDAGIVYCLSRKKVEETAEFLNDAGIAALAYHAGMDAGIRSQHQARFLREDGIVMVATVAFGMGIDKPDVRFVAHLDLPKSVEGYYQETGRAGRDGLPSTAWLAYGLQDVVQQRQLIDKSEGDAAHKRRMSQLLDAMLASLDIARGQAVYIANAVKCRPPGNRTPESAEIAACLPYLERQIALLKPKIIVLLGKVAVHALLHDVKALGSLRGRRFEYTGIPVVVTYHPAYLLRNLPEKAKAWEDLLFARRLLRESRPAAIPASLSEPELPF